MSNVVHPDKEPILVHRHPLRSRYSETDKMGYVYYGRYLEYFEVARTEMIRSAGLPYGELEDQGIMLPVVHAEIDYKVPVYYDELMHVNVYLYDIPAVKLDTFYTVTTRRSPDPHVIGQVTLCFMNEKSRRPCRAPDHFLDGLKKVVADFREEVGAE